jgi:hypothetical protein
MFRDYLAYVSMIWRIPRGISDFSSTCRLSGKEDVLRQINPKVLRQIIPKTKNNSSAAFLGLGLILGANVYPIPPVAWVALLVFVRV